MRERAQVRDRMAETMRTRSWAIVGAVAVMLDPARVRAAPPTPPSPPPQETNTDTPLARAEVLYRRGVSRYEVSKYDEAIAMWTEAYDILEATPENRAIRNDLVYNIARAQVQAFRIDDDLRRLRLAKQLLARYLEVYRELSAGDPAAEAEIARADRRMAEIDQMLREAEARAVQRDERARGSAAGKAAEKQARTLVISGAIGTAIGAVGLGVAFAGVAIGVRADARFEDEPARRDELRRRGRQANALVAAGAAVGGTFLAAGIALLVVGTRKQKRLRAAPTASAGRFGIVVEGRF